MSDIIYTPPASSGGGVNPTSTYMPVNIGGTFVDSIIQCIPNTFAQSIRAGSGFGFGTNVIGSSCDSWLGDWNNQIDGIFLQVKNDTISSRIFTANRGLYLDYVLNRYIFGDWANVYNKTQFVIDDQSELIYTKNNTVSTGISCDFNLRQYLFGSYGAGNLTYLSIEDTQQRIYTNSNGSIRGFLLDIFGGEFYYGDYANGTYFKFSNNVKLETFFQTIPNGLELDNNVFYYRLGDYFGQADNVYLEIDSVNPIIKTNFFGSSNLFKVGGTSTKLEASLGDYANNVNGTYINIIDNTKQLQLITSGGQIQLDADLLLINGNVTTPTSSGFSGDHLQVSINGFNYVIRLENP